MAGNPVTKNQVGNSLDTLRLVVSEVVELDGSDYGNCPFHDEATNSFNIFRAKSGRARYYCFGCQASGDVFNFLQKTKQFKFAEAIEYVSKLLDRPISRQSSPSEVSGSLDTNTEFQGLSDTKDDPPTKFCEKDCPKYLALKEDYEAILEQH